MKLKIVVYIDDTAFNEGGEVTRILAAVGAEAEEVVGSWAWRAER